jgi:glycosyltransferase involved in cell wall biosynthesis
MNLPEPVFRSASILPDEYEFLQDFCKANNVRQVIEFGPGVSTLAFLRAGCAVVSVEDNPRHFQEAQRGLWAPDCALLLGSPPAIMEHPAISGRTFDLAFVDGPAAKGPLPRLHSVQAAMSLAPVVMIHDANRPGERAAIAEMMKDSAWSLETRASSRGIAILRRKGKALRVRFICNAHSIGGGEFSSSYLMSELAKGGHEVSLSPCRTINAEYPEPKGVNIRRSYTEEPAVECDLLVFYANDHPYNLEENREAWEKALGAAGRTVAVLNFVVGQAVSEWFASRLGKVIFLNSTKEREFLDRAKGFKGRSQVLPPPVDLKPFLAIQPDYSKITFIRHSRVDGKYVPEETTRLISKFLKVVRGAEFWFMAVPPFLRPLAQANSNIHLLGWNEEPVAQFLSHGSVFWYRLPPTLRDQGPRVIVEAMAAGIPCIADNRDGAKDRITTATGWLCNNADDYVAAVREIADNPSILRQKGEAARQRATQHFRPEQWIDALLSTL